MFLPGSSSKLFDINGFVKHISYHETDCSTEKQTKNKKLEPLSFQNTVKFNSILLDWWYTSWIFFKSILTFFGKL